MLLLGCGGKNKSNGSAITTAIHFAEENHEVGMMSGDTLVYDFHFTNTGENPLVINKLETSCGCLTVVGPKVPVMPGKKGIISLTYVREKGLRGKFFRSVLVYSNATDQPVTLSISGMN